MTYAALVPVKTLTEAKSRLSAVLTQQQRRQLVLDMLCHVLHTLQASAVLEQVAVVSPDPEVLAYAHTWGALALTEEVPGHNEALQAAAVHLQTTGITALLTLSADLPLLQVEDVQAMVEKSKHIPVVIAPSSEGTGTNAILMRPPLAIPYVFGPNSFPSYLQVAIRQHVPVTLYQSTGVSLDIDTHDDLQQLKVLSRQVEQCQSSRMYSFQF